MKVEWNKICRVDIPEGKSGAWIIEKFTIREGDRQAVHYGLQNREVKKIPVGTYTRLVRDGKFAPMMSDTPIEIKDHHKILYEARRRGGRILINGLGIGMVIKGVLSFPNVREIDVVEISSDVIKLVAPTYQNDSRVNIIHADAFTIEWAKSTRWNVVWHDIWGTISKDNLVEMAELHYKYRRMCDWQGSWCEHECKIL